MWNTFPLSCTYNLYNSLVSHNKENVFLQPENREIASVQQLFFLMSKNDLKTVRF